jgi:hypothetical protein
VQVYDVPPDAGRPITPSGAPVTVSDDRPRAERRLTFAGTAGQRVSLKVSACSYSSATAQLLDPSGTAVGGSVPFGDGGGFVDTRTLPSTGTYAITVDPPQTTVGSATFTLYNVAARRHRHDHARQQLRQQHLGAGPERDLHLQRPAGQRISLKVGPSTISTGYVSITGPNGSQVVNKTPFFSSSDDVRRRAQHCRRPGRTRSRRPSKEAHRFRDARSLRRARGRVRVADGGRSAAVDLDHDAWPERPRHASPARRPRRERSRLSNITVPVSVRVDPQAGRHAARREPVRRARSRGRSRHARRSTVSTPS